MDRSDYLKEKLKQSLENEEDLMRSYLIIAEKVHNNEELQTRLREFAEGNAKRSQQLIHELNQFH
ncbi:hypothetical protein ACJ2A9_12060 [Anaerobacillus sp. MEB173]|uniref:hypothetical protein n=1 Tax=Anaerobacillus sp. MEB173 TaxID=3383345 RepID=UPI003F9242E2